MLATKLDSEQMRQTHAFLGQKCPFLSNLTTMHEPLIKQNETTTSTRTSTPFQNLLELSVFQIFNLTHIPNYQNKDQIDRFPGFN